MRISNILPKFVREDELKAANKHIIACLKEEGKALEPKPEKEH
jgi:hypothetical protein